MCMNVEQEPQQSEKKIILSTMPTQQQHLQPNATKMKLILHKNIGMSSGSMYII